MSERKWLQHAERAMRSALGPPERVLIRENGTVDMWMHARMMRAWNTGGYGSLRRRSWSALRHWLPIGLGLRGYLSLLGSRITGALLGTGKEARRAAELAHRTRYCIEIDPCSSQEERPQKNVYVMSEPS